jgi:Cu2+-exporting ATPase
LLERAEATLQILDDVQQTYIDPLIDKATATSLSFVRTHLLPLLPASIRTIHLEHMPIIGDARKQYAHILFGADAEEEPTAEELALRRQLAVCIATFGYTSLAALVAPPLMVLSIPGMLYMVGWFYHGSYRQLVYERHFGVMTLASISVTGMFLLGEFWALALWSMLFIPANILVTKTRRKSRQQLVNMLGETPRFVWVQYNGSEVRIPFEHLQSDDIIVVGAGETIPVDGTITHGNASIDQHVLTGEAQPVEKTSGERVYAATVVLAGRLHVHVEQAGDATVAAQIGMVLARTANYHPTLQLRGWQLAESLVLPMAVLGIATLPVLGPTSAVAVITCGIGVQMRMSAPISVLNVLHMATDYGILVKDGRVLELLTQVDTVVFDKTGTLTHEQPHVNTIHCYGDYQQHDVLQLAATAETRQSHPIAHAILHEAQTQQLAFLPLDDTTFQPGYGLCVQLTDGRQVRVGSARFLQQEGIGLPVVAQATLDECHTQGHALVFVAVNDELAGAIELHTTIRSEITAVVQNLHQRGLHLVIISGDHAHPTERLAHELGIDEYFAEVLPQQKASLVEELQRRGRTVCFVGDGINDSIALKRADVSVSLRGATTVAMDTAQVVLMDESLAQLPRLFDLAHELERNMQGNFLAATVPGTINIGSVYLLHTGVMAANLLATAGLVTGLANAMVPLLKHRPPAMRDTSNALTLRAQASGNAALDNQTGTTNTMDTTNRSLL